MDASVHSQQRKDLRISYEENIRFSTDKFNWHLGRSQNISKRGIFVETAKMLKIGSTIYLNFKIPNKVHTKHVKAVGEVVRLTGAEEKSLDVGGAGIGVQFSLLLSEEVSIRNYIKGMVKRTVPSYSPTLYPPAEPVDEKAASSLSSLLKWWAKEAVAKASTSNGLVVELVILAIVVVVVVKAFF